MTTSLRPEEFYRFSVVCWHLCTILSPLVFYCRIINRPHHRFRLRNQNSRRDRLHSSWLYYWFFGYWWYVLAAYLLWNWRDFVLSKLNISLSICLQGCLPWLHTKGLAFPLRLECFWPNLSLLPKDSPLLSIFLWFDVLD